MAQFKITETGIVFVPKFVKTESDYKYGELVSHEAYNEHINLNSTQGDYNTEILRLLFTDPNPANVPHIPYLDTIVEHEVNRIDSDITTLQGYADTIDKAAGDSQEALGAIAKIISGETIPKYADNVAGIKDAGNSKYYGTDKDGAQGFHDMPAALYAEPISSNAIEISGIYYTPRENSVSEAMLDEAARLKLNQTGITDYQYLTGKPSINGVDLTGNITLEQLGVQAVGNYITAIPEEYVTDTELAEAIEPYLKTEVANNSYATKDTVDTLSTTVDLTKDTADKAAVICVGSFTGTPKTGDLVIYV